LITNHRIDTIDFARGIGIAMVVYGHVLRGLEVRGLAEGHWIQIHDEVVYAFHMPLFFFLSGLFIARGLHRNSTAFMQDRLVTIAYPYVIWSVIQTCLAAVATPGSPTDVGLRALVEIWKSPIAQFWFLFALFVCHFSFLVFWKHPKIIYVLAIVGLFAPNIPGLPPIYTTALSYFPFIVAGWQVDKWLRIRLPSVKKRSTLTLTIIAIAAFALIYSLRYFGYFQPTRSIDLLLATAGIVAVVAGADLIPSSFTILGQIGQSSMAIFILHTIIVGAARLVELQLGWIEPIFMLASLTLIGVIAPFVIFMIASHYNVAHYIGLGRSLKKQRTS
jgi:fucose 4-O-acetylase-like acetyltransferase